MGLFALIVGGWGSYSTRGVLLELISSASLCPDCFTVGIVSSENLDLHTCIHTCIHYHMVTRAPICLGK